MGKREGIPMKEIAVDLNADVGESFGIYRLSNDEELFPYLSSVNIACGLHAGDPLIMEETARKALKLNLAIGAHPGYPDLQGFGRRKLSLTPREVKSFLIYQVGALWGFLKVYKGKLSHVKPHGALYNDAAVNPELALAIAEAVQEIDPDLILLARSGSEMVKQARIIGTKVVEEAFADRHYLESGDLVPRNHPQAIISDHLEVSRRALLMVLEQKVQTLSGSWIPLSFKSLCIHGDNPNALNLARTLRQAFQENGIKVVPIHSIIEK
jgi:UPF0271 protein